MNLPDFYRYTAIFTFEDDGVHITFPDLPGCVSFAANEKDATETAKEALALHLYGMEADGEEILAPSPVRNLAAAETLESNESFFMVEVFMPAFREKQNERSVKKTLTIPYWLNAEAERYGINFSHALQYGIKHQLNMDGFRQAER